MRSLDGFPPDLLIAVEERARADADLLCDLLKAAGYWSRAVGPVEPAALSRAADVAAALRIETWERSALVMHLDEDLPASTTAIREICATPVSRSMGDASGPPAAPLARRVLGLWLRRCAWSAPTLLGVDIALEGPESLSDRALEPLADLLWAVCQGGQQNGDGNHGST